MKRNSIRGIAKSLLLGSILAFGVLSLQACYDQTKQVKTERGLKSNCTMKCQAGKCKTGKCGNAKETTPVMKRQSGKCGTAKEAAPAMKCQPGKCGQGK